MVSGTKAIGRVVISCHKIAHLTLSIGRPTSTAVIHPQYFLDALGRAVMFPTEMAGPNLLAPFLQGDELVHDLRKFLTLGLLLPVPTLHTAQYLLSFCFVTSVHKDISERLPAFNRPLYLQVKQVLDVNKAQRHIRGGIATRKKYRGV